MKVLVYLLTLSLLFLGANYFFWHLVIKLAQLLNLV
jgi:hypothetical protein